jgi:Glycosyl hydrolase family 1
VTAEQTRRGAAFSTASTLGTSASSDLGRSEGNGFLTRWADDLDALAELGVRAVRLSLDWARLQPRPKVLDGEWVEWYGSLLTTSLRLGLEPWLTLYDGSIPTWFDDEGGFGDAVAAGRWWPRWVERIADQFGDAAAGWVPLVVSVDNARPVWRDTWTALRGGRRVVRPFTLPDERHLLDGGDQSCDVVGVVLEPMSTGSTIVDDRIAERELERMGELLRMAAEECPEGPLAIAAFGSSLLDPDSHGRVVEQLRLAIDDIVSDGVDVEVAFVGPAVSVGENHLGLVDRDAGPTVAGAAWFG